MKVNTKTRYGLRTMIEIALQENNRGILQKDIAKREDISEKYLDHIIAGLKAAGLITNVAGKKSGYMLTQPANKLTTYDIYKAFNNDLALADCLEQGKQCNKEEFCAANDFWNELNDHIKEKMNSVTLKQLAEKQNELHNQSGPQLYYI
ncbi:MAG: Rrf2 family transcriptional regulator [Bacteroidales bacterium]